MPRDEMEIASGAQPFARTDPPDWFVTPISTLVAMDKITNLNSVGFLLHLTSAVGT